MKENRNNFHLERILDSINRVEKHLNDVEFDFFVKDGKTYDAVLMQLINIGETVSRITEKFREEHYYLPWHKAIGMRNQIAHGYFEIEAKEVWETVKEDLPALKKDIEKLL